MLALGIILRFGDPQKIFGDPKKGRDPQFENHCVNPLMTIPVITLSGAIAKFKINNDILINMIIWRINIVIIFTSINLFNIINNFDFYSF